VAGASTAQRSPSWRSAPKRRNGSSCSEYSALSLVGSLAPVAPTPFDGLDEVDYAGQKRILDFLIDAGVDRRRPPSALARCRTQLQAAENLTQACPSATIKRG
jgi:hypothetical protein